MRRATSVALHPINLCIVVRSPEIASVTVAGRGFQQRRQDMRRLLKATDGKVFTLATLQLLIEQTRVKTYRTS